TGASELNRQLRLQSGDIVAPRAALVAALIVRHGTGRTVEIVRVSVLTESLLRLTRLSPRRTLGRRQIRAGAQSHAAVLVLVHHLPRVASNVETAGCAERQRERVRLELGLRQAGLRDPRGFIPDRALQQER